MVQERAVSGHHTARVLIYTHRWLGISLGLLFILWFLSGIVMLYARMPALDPNERLARLPAIAPASIRVDPPRFDGDIIKFSLVTLEGRPVYRTTTDEGTRLVFADTGDAVPAVDRDQALRVARRFAAIGDVRYDAHLIDSDQWTFDVRRRMPVHRIAVDDIQGTRLYVAEAGGDVIAKTTTSGRRWAWAGAVIHWIYFAPLRRHASIWSNTIIVLSLAGTLLCIVGIAWGLWRIAPMRGYRLRNRQQWTPYSYVMRWHHYLGLIFGMTTLMWVFSGLLSMDPWNWSPGTAPTREQQLRLAEGPFSTADLSAARIRRAIEGFRPYMPKEVDIVRFRGRYYASAVEGIVSLDEPYLGAREQLPPDLVIGAAAVLMPAQIAGMHWMEDYDSYYYDRARLKSLPVLRVRYDDPQQTWLYIDPRHGAIARKEERLSRINRWLYHGLHSFDFPFLYNRRPLWDIVVIACSIGGLVLSATTIVTAWRRLRRHGRRLTAAPPAS